MSHQEAAQDILFEYIVLSSTDFTIETDKQIEAQISLLYQDKNVKFLKHSSKDIHDLVVYLSLKNRYPNTDDHTLENPEEIELNHPILLFVDHQLKPSSPGLNSLSISDLKLLISEYFHHLNIIFNVYNDSIASDDSSATINLPSKETILLTEILLKSRSKRVLSWIGYDCKKKHLEKSLVSSMVDDLKCASLNQETNFTDLLVNEIEYIKLLNLPHPKSYYIDMVYNWGFKSHLLSYDELLYCAKIMIETAFKNCNVELQEKISTNTILLFAFNVRDNYRMGNQFHNFRHAVDVLQLTFYLLVRLNCLPDNSGSGVNTGKSFISKVLLTPDISLTLLIASFGHDIGHPGLTNKFLTDHKTPILKHFNDISVLESFHYMEFRSILDKFFPDIFTIIQGSEEIIKKSILSTDMINHFAYIDKIDDFMKFQKDVDEQVNIDDHVIEIRYLLCSLIIKCADISNVSRPLDISAKWGVSLTNETNEILCLEKNLKNDPALETTFEEFVHTITDLTDITPTEVVDKLPSICNGQCFFIKNFVIMFFEKIQIILPELKFLYEHINENVHYWEKQVKW